MVKELTGSYKIKYHANGLDNDPIEIDFTPPFRFMDHFTHNVKKHKTTLEVTFAHNFVANFYRRLDMVEELEKMANLNIPKDFSGDEANKYLVDACAKFEIKCPPPQTTARLLDKVCLWCFPLSL